VLVVSTARQDPHVEPPRVRSNLYPSVAQIAGHALNSIFLDSLNADIELLQRINRTISLIPPDRVREAGLPLRQIKVLVISPSQPIERMVVRHVQELPWTIRFLLRGIGAMNRNGSNLASYLLFESGYCRALIDLGYQDTMARRGELVEFLSPRP
jgi:NTE family protein